MLGLGLLAVNLFGPGVGMNVEPQTLDTKAISTYTAASAKPVSFVDFLINMVPTSIESKPSFQHIEQPLGQGVRLFASNALQRSEVHQECQSVHR